MNIAFVGAHPYLGLISAHLHRNHNITSHDKADIVFMGGYSNTFDQFRIINKPTILLSSYNVYLGQNHKEDITEDVAVSIHPLSDLSVISLNYLQRETVLLHELEHVIVLRTFPVYGFKNDESFVSKIVQSAKAKEIPQKYRLGWRIRSFLFVEDFLAAIDATIIGLQQRQTGIFNLGSTEAKTIQETAKLTYRLANLDTECVEEPWKELPWRPTRCIPSTERFKLVFGWKPIVSLNVGIKSLLDRSI